MHLQVLTAMSVIYGSTLRYTWHPLGVILMWCCSCWIQGLVWMRGPIRASLHCIMQSSTGTRSLWNCCCHTGPVPIMLTMWQTPTLHFSYQSLSLPVTCWSRTWQVICCRKGCTIQGSDFIRQTQTNYVLAAYYILLSCVCIYKLYATQIYLTTTFNCI